MKNRIHLFLLLITVSVFLSACVKDELDASCRDDKGQFQLTLSIGDPEDVAFTRSVASRNERLIKDLYLLVFDATTNLYKTGEKVAISRLTDNGTAEPKLISDLMVKTGDKFVVLANTGQTIETIPLTQGVSTTADINAAFPSGDVLENAPEKKWEFKPSSGGYLPMSGEFVVASLTSAQTCTLRRSIAKVNVVFDRDFKDATGIFATANTWFLIVNSANYGHVYASEGTMSIPTSGMTFGMYNSNIEVPKYSVTLPTLSRYIPEYNSSVRAKDTPVAKTEFHKDRMCIILRVDIGKVTSNRMYYRLDIATGNTDAEIKEFLDIVRNKHYMVTIKNVKWAGYTTMEEALSAPGSNLEYEIKVRDDNDNMTSSNGQYAVSLSNDETIIKVGAAVVCEVATARYVIADEFKSKILPTDLTNKITTSLANSYGELLTTSLTDADAPILFKFKNNVARTFTVTIQFGNISRTITVRRQMAFDAHYGITSFAVSPETQSLTWLKTFEGLTATQNPDGTLTLDVAMENVTPVRWDVADANGNASVSSESNIAAFPIFEDHYAEAFAMRTGSSPGRLKVIIFRNNPMYGGWWGGEPAEAAIGSPSSTYFGKRLIVEGVEEAENYKFATNKKPYGAFDVARGHANTTKLMTATTKTDYAAAYCCYLKNDRNGNGAIDADEPVLWYLPAQAQFMGIYVYVGSWQKNFTNAMLYWSSTETALDESYSDYYTPWAMTLYSGDMSHSSGMGNGNNVRCVRDL